MRRAQLSVEPARVLNGTPALERGAYLLCTPNLKEALNLAAGRKVIALTRNPEPFKRAHLPYLWLSNVNAENAIDPLRLPAIMNYLISNSDENTVVLIDGLEYLVVENGFNSVLKFLTALKDNLLLRGATLLIVLDPATFSESELAAIKREFEVLQSHGKPKTSI